MITRGRLLAALIAVLVAVGAYSAWLVLQVRSDLRDAEASARQLQTALEGGDSAARDAATAGLQGAAASAADRTDGAWWGAFTYLPVVGDDAQGVRALSTSLDVVARDAVGPLVESEGMIDGLLVEGRVDIDVLEGLQGPVNKAHAAFRQASTTVSEVDSSGFAGSVKGGFDRYVALVDGATQALASAGTATDVLPSMVGAESPRDYLLVFQNNAEIRATGGMPGSWALVHADAGELSLAKQGTAADFPVLDDPVLPLSQGEEAVYGRQLGVYWQDAGFAPDFPRAAQLWSARWDLRFPDVPLDGVISLDPVGLSYLMDGTGPVQVGDTTLTSANLVEELLNKPYLTLQPAQQDALFQRAAKTIFEKSTGDLASPLAFVKGLNRAANEDRLLVASFDDDIRADLSGTRVEGALTKNDGSTPHVDIGLNDATGSKMSYYLRYWADARATECSGGIQTLAGSMTLNQRISPADAAELPVSVTGGGNYGTEPGSQLVLVRFYGPYGGRIDSVQLDGKRLRDLEATSLDGRPVATVVVLLSNRDDVVLTWSMKAGPTQTGDLVLGVTPSVVQGSNDATFGSAC